MNSQLRMDFTVNEAEHSISIQREFIADITQVWDAWTKPEILDIWWAPRPWKARTKSMDFRDGGHWHYAMVGPEGDEHWGWADYQNIQIHERFTGLDAFADENGHKNKELPQSKWEVSFTALGEKTLIENNITFPDLAQLEATIQMGFKEGMTSAMEGLDEYFQNK